MAGNSSRRGAVRKASTKKGAQVGSGGQRRRGLEGRGPTPKASERTGHPAARKAAAATKRSENRAAQSKQRTPKAGAEVIFGRNSVLEALREGIPATTLYVASRTESEDRLKESVRRAVEQGIPLIETTRTELDTLAGRGAHQGILLSVPEYTYAVSDDLLAAAFESNRAPLFVALDGVTDTRNLGAIIRSAGAFGAHGVIVPERRAAGVGAATWKTSAGAAARVPVARATNLVRTLKEFKKQGVFVVGLDGGGTSDVSDLPVAAGPVVLVAGAEGKGLSRLVRETCDLVAAIPISSSVESLNASVATSLALYEVSKQRR
ncbi:23S rRNA (guanosine(2251)-2'-O)-methyltransferase RlmB [Serinibacter salmoneus]|uniref:23S rRNA (Guanosine2251-2'-O)-methyltransferase n=1 Tax=Serinibacter salmoneus TaxID=556530 RepID=A0A2A9D2N1_9MICO|nr:23S rRNA (guanosine(2251)-2'-O)-methyltransferase RlmB [Serinibacter salmoneus]PFG20596.1 23S rRNA (guanosine2251-2'-O)-methyltransferase [Serinibacter salmoneus]